MTPIRRVIAGLLAAGLIASVASFLFPWGRGVGMAGILLVQAGIVLGLVELARVGGTVWLAARRREREAEP